MTLRHESLLPVVALDLPDTQSDEDGERGSDEDDEDRGGEAHGAAFRWSHPSVSRARRTGNVGASRSVVPCVPPRPTR